MKSRLKVLIADDTALMRLLLRKSLEAAGFEIVGEACDGDAAVKQYVSLKPDLVVMDIIMPKKDGIAATKAIISVHPQAKIFIITTLVRTEVVRDALLAGACGFISKPFHSPRLIKTLRDAFL